MKLECCLFSELSKYVINEEKRIIMFGSGAIGQVSTPEILNSYNLLSYVDCYIDNDEKKWNQTIAVCGKSFTIRSPQYLESCSSKTIILLNIAQWMNIGIKGIIRLVDKKGK